MRTPRIAALVCITGTLLPTGLARASDTNAEFTILLAKAEKGEAQSQFETGAAFFSGEFSLATNYVEAVKWFRKAAERNLALAQYRLGNCYHEGLGVATNYMEAVKWFRKAAKQNLPRAQCNLGVCYAKGRGVPKDEAQAMKLYRQVGEGGEPDGFNCLAWILATSENAATRDGVKAIGFA
jgi:TPR repeat protein